MKNNKGFTLVELMIYTVIFVAVVGLLAGVLISVLRTQGIQSSEAEVTQQLDLVLTTTQRLVRDASLIDISYEGASTSTLCSAYCSLRLLTETDSTNPTIISSDANGVYLKEGSGATTTLTTGRITVDFLRFTKFEVAGGHAAVQIDASFSFNTSNPQRALTRTLQSAISRVSAAVFDSDLIPNADNIWSIGQAAVSWRDLILSNDLTVGNNASIGGDVTVAGGVAVGTGALDPTAILTLNSTSKGFLPPRMTTAERDNNISSPPAVGLTIYNTTTNQSEEWNGSSWSATGAGGNWTASGTDIFSANFGNVGIGVTNPDSVFHIETTNDTELFKLTSNQSAEIIFEPQNTFSFDYKIQAENDNFKIREKDTGGSWKTVLHVIGSSRRLGIGGVSPSYQLHLSTDSAAKPGGGSWTNSSSDERVKTDIRPFIDGLDVILGINPVWYKYNGKGGIEADGTEYVGVIAQDIQEVAPYTVGTYMAKLNPDDETETELLNFNSTALTFNLINAVKELNLKVDSLLGAVGDAVVKVKALTADIIKARKVQVEYVEYIDRATGEIYCVWIENGDFVKDKGGCE